MKTCVHNIFHGQKGACWRAQVCQYERVLICFPDLYCFHAPNNNLIASCLLCFMLLCMKVTFLMSALFWYHWPFITLCWDSRFNRGPPQLCGCAVLRLFYKSVPLFPSSNVSYICVIYKLTWKPVPAVEMGLISVFLVFFIVILFLLHR